jgi:hypothetical protein
VRRLGVSPAQVSALVERMRRKGLLDGCRPPGDRRRQMWRLTDRGRDALGDAFRAIRPWVERVERRLGPERSAEIGRALDKLVSLLHDAAPDAGRPLPASSGRESDREVSPPDQGREVRHVPFPPRRRGAA